MKRIYINKKGNYEIRFKLDKMQSIKQKMNKHNKINFQNYLIGHIRM